MNQAATSTGLITFQQPRYLDERGYFTELFRTNHSQPDIQSTPFMQDNLSVSIQGTLRGMHYQTGDDRQCKLVIPIQGQIYDVVVDLRKQSPTFGQWFGFDLHADRGDQLFVPGEFAHGFYVTSEVAIVMYKCSSEYAPAAEASIHWNDPDLGIQWPLINQQPPLVSDKDQLAGSFKDAPTFDA